MPDDEWVELVTLLDRPMDREGWSSELVRLGSTAGGDVILRVDAGGKVVQMYAGDLNAGETTVYRVLARDLPRLREVLGRELGLDVSTDRALIEGLRALVAPDAQDDGGTIANKLLWWLRGRGIAYESASVAFPYD